MWKMKGRDGRSRFRGLAVLIAGAMLLLWTGLPVSANQSEVESFADITVDRTTPELHLKTFLTAMRRTIARMEAREWARNYYDAWLYPAITGKQSAEIRLLKRYILNSFDLSGLPEWRRKWPGWKPRSCCGTY